MTRAAGELSGDRPPISTDPTAVQVDGLVKHYRARTAVAGATFTAARGAVTAVLGPNGAGKTTTMECCEGLRRPDGGTVRVLGRDPLRGGRDLRARVGVMLQDGGLPAAARAADLLRLVAAQHARPHDPGRLLELLELTAAARTPTRRLSGGQRQRLALALALVGRPEVVFLDEPTAGLDPQARHLVWDVIRGLRSAGVAVLLTTHLLDEAERLADQVVLMAEGRVVVSGTPAELTGTGGESIRFEAAAGLPLRGLADRLPTEVRAAEPVPGRYLIDGPPGAVNAVVLATVTAWCAEQGIMPQGLTVGRRTLEDVFFELTGQVGADTAARAVGTGPTAPNNQGIHGDRGDR